MTDAPMPPDLDRKHLSNDDLLEAYAGAIGWVDGAYTAKQGKAWEKHATLLRSEIMRRMAHSSPSESK